MMGSAHSVWRIPVIMATIFLPSTFPSAACFFRQIARFNIFDAGSAPIDVETTKCGVGIQFPDCPLIPRHIFCSGSPISEHIRVLMPCVPHFLCEKFFYIVFCADYNVNFNTVPIRVTGANNPLTYFVLLAAFLP